MIRYTIYKKNRERQEFEYQLDILRRHNREYLARRDDNPCYRDYLESCLEVAKKENELKKILKTEGYNGMRKEEIDLVRENYLIVEKEFNQLCEMEELLFPVTKEDHPHLPIFNSKSIIRPMRRELKDIISFEFSTFTLSNYSFNNDSGYIKYRGRKIFHFNSPIDFSTFWEFWVGIYFYELRLDKNKKVITRKAFSKQRGRRVFFKDYLDNFYKSYLYRLQQFTDLNVYELLGDCLSVEYSGGGDDYIDTLKKKRFRMRARDYIKFISKDQDCIINRLCNFKHYLFWRYMIPRNDLYDFNRRLLSKNRNILNVELSIFFNTKEVKTLLYLFKKIFNRYKKNNANIGKPIPIKNSQGNLITSKKSVIYKKVISYYLPKLINTFNRLTKRKNKKIKK